MRRSAMIVGGSRGIGEATAARLVRDGWRVQDLSRTSGVDVTDRAALGEALRGAACPDLLVYSAGHVEPAPLLDVSAEAWDYHVEVNLTAAWRVLTWWARRRAKWHQEGAAVLIASTAATRPSPQWSAYAAAKAGLVNLGLTAAAELGPLGLRVYVLAPGRCATALRRTLAPGEDPATIMQPGDVAGVVANLADDAEGVLAGQVIEVARRWR